MLKIIKNNNIKKSKIVLSQPKKGKEIEITRHFPPITKYWLNSIYSYNKNTIKSIPLLNNIVNNIIKYYFNLKLNVNLSKKLIGRRIKKIRLSTTKIFVSKAEIKHSNDKVIINLYTYNGRKKIFYKKLRKLYRKFFASSINNLAENKIYSNKLLGKFKPEIDEQIRNLLKYLKNKKKDYRFWRKVYKLQKKYKKYNKIFLYRYFVSNIINTSKNNYDNLIYLKYSKIYKNKRILFDKTMIRSEHLLNAIKKNGIFRRKDIKSTKHNILRAIKRNTSEMDFKWYCNLKKFLIKDALRKEMLYLKYSQLLNTDVNKFNNIYLSRLGKLLENIYKKKVEFNIINLKYIYLDSHIFSEAIILKIRNRKNKLIKVMKKSLKLQKFNLYDNNFNLQKMYLSKYNKSNTKNLLTNDCKKDVLDYLLKKIFNINNIYHNQEHKYPNTLYVYRCIKFRVLRGIRIEIKGRLTRRLTASRSVSKLRYKGSLSNFDSSVKGLSSVMIRNHLRSNIDYVNLNSKTRNGSFGIKGWISSN